ncbi:SAM-dependent methyltransferase [Colletotrichum sublineola]|uniref:Putative SAM-dependent methyltransferase n=1 Tax=Colletotrichum sublineola TaxID=1173701 RepID=A0A066X341_COLSU|nr:SAM-dependent methyltransferase [Colletotrichum sublineola]KDN63558.1 putative SAM-dependent methyltransferase [Colletotrichum sublineola]
MSSMPPSRLDTILSCYLYASNQKANVAARFTHRVKICDAWAIPQGAKLLDIGCGQGESTLVLAEAVGSTGSITGIDNAPPDYGGPYTIDQAQAHILASVLGHRITFECSETTKWLQERSRAFLESSSTAPSCPDQVSPLSSTRAPDARLGEQNMVEFDGAVLCHSLWYFPSANAVRELLETLATANIPRIYIAEWSGQARTAAQVPHALAAEAEMKLYSLRSRHYVPRFDEQNVRGGALLPDDLVVLAEQVGWSVARRGLVPAPLAMRDGHWETQYLLRGRFKDDVVAEVKDMTTKCELLGYRNRIASAVEALKANGGSVECMDTAWIVLEKD